MVTEQFDEFENELVQCDWYRLPLEVQRMLLIFIANTQTPAIFFGYGQIECSRHTFEMVNYSEL